jgi:hypothetical protein
MSKRLQITAQQLRDLIREVEFHEKRMQTVITLWGEKIGWVQTRDRMRLLKRLLNAIAKGYQIEIVEPLEVSENVGAHR